MGMMQMHQPARRSEAQTQRFMEPLLGRLGFVGPSFVVAVA